MTDDVYDYVEALRLLREALHLRQHGENAPGGNETWRAWDYAAELYLRRQLCNKYGHDYDNQGKCQTCGALYVVRRDASLNGGSTPNHDS